MRVGIQILNFNGLRWLPGVLDSLKRHGLADQILYLVDNGSTDDSLNYVMREHPDVVVVSLGENLGYGGAYNRSIYRAFADGDIGSSVKLELIDEVAGGGEVYECSPIISSTQYCPAGEKLDNALHVVLEALR